MFRNIMEKMHLKRDNASIAPPRDGPSMLHKLLRWALRFLQFVFGVAVVGLYAQHLSNESQQHQPMTPSFVYGVVVGVAAALSATLFSLPFVGRIRILWAWDALMFILWVAVFGTFARIYLHRPDDAKDEYQGTNTEHMKHALWVDVVNVALWLVSAAAGAFFWLRRGREAKAAPAMSEFVPYEQA